MTNIENTNQKEHPDLYKRSIKGGYWVFAIKAATQGLGFVKSIIVFNILFSEGLELIFIANLLMAALTIFSESGFRAALVQKKDDIESYLDTAWVIGILRGIVLFAAIFFIAPLFASFKVDDPEKATLAISVIRAMGFCFLIGAFKNIGTVYFQKELHFHKTFWLTMTGSIAEIALSIVLLLVYRNVWAVVTARLLSAVINLAMGYILCPYRPKFHFIPEKARELWTFGKWLFGVNILGYLLNEGDDWFVLFFYPEPLPFKLYNGAYKFANIPVTYISHTISQVSFPVYSKIQGDLSRLCEAYLKVLRSTAMVTIPLIFLIVILSSDFVMLFLVEQSHAIIPVIQIFTIKGLFRCIGSTRVPLLKAVGKPKILSYLMGLRVILLSLLIYPFTKKWGISGTAFCFVIINLIIDPIAVFVTARALKMNIYKLWSPSILPLAASVIMSLFLLSMKVLMTEVTLLRFALLITTGATAYPIILWILDGTFTHGFRQLILEQVAIINKKAIRSK